VENEELKTHPLPAIASTPTVFSALLILLSLQIILAALRRRKGFVRNDAVIALTLTAADLRGVARPEGNLTYLHPAALRALLGHNHRYASTRNCRGYVEWNKFLQQVREGRKIEPK